MASEDNVVKLKHLQPFANGFSIPNGDNVVRLKHLVSLASAIADESLDSSTQQPVLSLGSWSATDSIYSAEIFYNGDGTLSTDIGSISNGVLTVEDVDGTFSGVITASGGESFAPVVASFTYNTDYVTISGGDDNKINRLLSADNDFKVFSFTDDYGKDNLVINYPTADSQPFLNGTATLSYSKSGSAHIITNSADGNSVTLFSDSSSAVYYPALVKLSENAAIVISACETVNGSYWYQGPLRATPVRFNSSGSIAKSSNTQILGAPAPELRVTSK